MSLVPLIEFRIEYPRFEDVPDIEIETRLNFVERNYCPVGVWLLRTKDGIKLRTAHLLEMEWLQTSLTSGAASQLAAGSSSSPPSPIEDDLNLTTYGRQFKQLRNTIPVFGVIL